MTFRDQRKYSRLELTTLTAHNFSAILQHWTTVHQLLVKGRFCFLFSTPLLGGRYEFLQFSLFWWKEENVFSHILQKFSLLHYYMLIIDMLSMLVSVGTISRMDGRGTTPQIDSVMPELGTETKQRQWYRYSGVELSPCQWRHLAPCFHKINTDFTSNAHCSNSTTRIFENFSNKIEYI